MAESNIPEKKFFTFQKFFELLLYSKFLADFISLINLTCTQAFFKCITLNYHISCSISELSILSDKEIRKPMQGFQFRLL